MPQDSLLVLDADGIILALNPEAEAAGLRVGGRAEALLGASPPQPGVTYLPGSPPLRVEALRLPDGGWAINLRAPAPSPALALRDAGWERAGNLMLHELNNVLMVILGQSEMGLRTAPEAHRRPLQRIAEAGGRLLTLTQAIGATVGGPLGAPPRPDAVISSQLAAMLGPHRTAELRGDPAVLSALPPPALGFIAATCRLLPPSPWIITAEPGPPPVISWSRPGEAGPLPALHALARAARAWGSALETDDRGRSYQLTLGAPPQRPAVVCVQDESLDALITEALAPRTCLSARSPAALCGALAEHSETATVILDGGAPRGGPWPSPFALHGLYATLPILCLRPPQGPNDPRIFSLGGPFTIAALRATMARLDQR